MSQVSAQSQDVQVDAQSVQSVQAPSARTVSPTQSQQQQQQQQSTSHGRGERQVIQRSSSSASSHSAGSAGAAASGRAEGPVGTGSYQQYSAEGGFGASNGSLGTVVSGERRQGRYRKQVIRLPDQPQGQVRQVRRRLLTPEPDTLERV
jgi:hypothetical protein